MTVHHFLSLLPSDPKEELPLSPGFRFHPTDEELIICYLMNKINDATFTTERAIAENLNSLLSSFTTNTEISSGSGFTIFPRDKTPTKSTPLHCAEETSFMTLAIHVSMTL
ncbi:hypothetical protein ACFX2I_008981 [Malus domestica]